MNIPKKILVVRNDKIGDFMLSFQALAILKTSLPESHITVLVPKYTAELATACKWVDNVIIDPGNNATLPQILNFYKSLRGLSFDAVITLFSTTRVGLGLLLAGIPFRLAPATKLAQIFYNHRLKQRRSQSLKPEYEYNSDLIRFFLASYYIPVKHNFDLPYLGFEKQDINQLHKMFCRTHRIPVSNKLIFIHPGSGGSASNLSLQQYALLIKELGIPGNYSTVLTAGPGEEKIISELSNLLGDTPHIKYISKEGLCRFSQHIQFCNLFISGSTGPLHIAGALNRPTVAFYPRRTSATPLRWQTLNTPDHRLAFTPPASAEESDMSKIDLIVAAEIIHKTFLTN
jgi:ADP-heptose:LPS heptosyltransferase